MDDLDIDTEVLIALVRNKPALWDKTKDIYKDKKAKKKVWDEVCISLNEDFQTMDGKDKSIFEKEVMKRWANVRDSFAKFCKKDKDAKKTGTRASKIKKYVYHDQMKFLAKLYNTRSVDENHEDEKDDDISQNYSETLSDAEGEDNLTSAETTSTTSRLSGSICTKRKRLDKSELKTLEVSDGEKSNRHLSFFNGIIPSLEEFNEQEVLKFQIQLIGSINDQRRITSHAQVPAQFFSFSSQPGPAGLPLNTTAYLPSIAASYPSGQPIFPTLWSAACSKCSSESTQRESSSNPVD